MLHDEFKQHLELIHGLLATNVLQTDNVERKHAMNLAEASLIMHPSVFYLDEIEFDEELNLTAVEFFEKGFLTAPMPETIFFYRSCMIEGREDWDSKDIIKMECPKLAIHVSTTDKKDGSILLIVHKLSSTADTALARFNMREIWVPDCAISVDVGENGQARIKQKPCIAGDRVNDEKEASMYAAMALQSLLISCMPHFDKVENRIPEKLNKARAKGGKSQLSPYITIKYRKEIRDELGHSGTGIKRRPHWRRGHVRRLASGKMIPVQPTLVNFRGGELPEQRPYRIVGEKQ